MAVESAFENQGMDVRERAKALVASMTLEEKVSQMVHEATAIERLDIPEYNWWNECLHGVGRAGRATVFPQPIGLGATFDDDLIERMAGVIGVEARAKYNYAVKKGNRGQYRGLTFWSPNVNIYRDGRWGRGHETFGEDPVLSGRLGSAFVRGLQQTKKGYMTAAACAKHYAVHSGPEQFRHEFDARCNDRDLWDTYLPAFETLVKEGVESVMGAYNRTNGEPCCGHSVLLVDILRGRWGFEGHVVSDCWAIKDFHENHKVTANEAESAALGVKMGCDLNCGCTYPALTQAVQEGLVSEVDLDVCLERLMATRIKLGLFDDPEKDPFADFGTDLICAEEHRAVSLEAAQKSLVLLKNEGGVLPLDPTIQRLFVIGHNAANIDVMLGNYFGNSARVTSVLEGVSGRAPEEMSIEYRIGNQMDRANTNPVDWVSFESRQYAVTVAVLGIQPLVEGEEGEAILSDAVGDRKRLELPEVQVEFIRKIAKNAQKLVVVLAGGSPIACPELHELADAVLFMWYPGEAGGEAVADVLFGNVSPSGKLPITFPMRTEDLPPYEDYDMTGRTYRYAEKEPLYPFGFGLSYTQFEYSDIDLKDASIGVDGSTVVSAQVRNAGSVAGEEVVQFYISDLEASCPVPGRALKAYKRIRLEPGESTRIEFNVTPERLALVNEAGERVIEPGAFRLWIAGSCPIERSAALGAPAPQQVELTVE